MRNLMIAALLLAGACGSGREEDTPGARPIAFDGAYAAEPSAKRAHGIRLTWILGCRGCHGKDLQGRKFDDDPAGYGILWASNLTRAVPLLSDRQLDDVIRKGVHPSRAELWVMPSENFQHLSDADTGALIDYLRTLRPVGEISPPAIIGPQGKREIESGEIKPAAKLVPETHAIQPVDLGPQHRFGRYIATTTCAECHGLKLEGREGDTPDLIVAGAYSREEFETLITKGVPTGGRKLKELMQDVAQNRYSRLTGNERDALYAYLKARAERPQ